METENTCRCCLVQGIHKDLNTAYIWLNGKEIYADMLKECFNIVLNSSQCSSNGICDSCISTLRASLAFRQQVLDAESVFFSRIQNVEPEEKPFQVKQEPKEDSGDDSDDYFLAELPSDAEFTDGPIISKEKEKSEMCLDLDKNLNSPTEDIPSSKTNIVNQLVIELPENLQTYSITRDLVIKTTKQAENTLKIPNKLFSLDSSSEKITTKQRESEVEKKLLRNLGLEYKAWSGKIVKAKSLERPCENCRMKCNEKFSEAERLEVFDKFWVLGDRQKQWQFIVMYSRRVKKNSGRFENSKRHYTFKYYLPKLCQEPDSVVPVCKTMFINTLSICGSIFTTAWKKFDGRSAVEVDRRGHHERNNKIINAEMVLSVCDHVKAMKKCCQSKKTGKLCVKVVRLPYKT